MTKYLDTWKSRYCDNGILGYLNTWIPGYLDTGISVYFDTRITGYQDTGIQGYLKMDTRISRYLVIGLSILYTVHIS